jgi:tetratricopeptide (TPR) repeat protein
VQAHAAYGLAGLCRDTGRSAEALDYAGLALSFADKAGFAFLKGLIVHRLGTIHQGLGDYDKAQRQYREARALARATANTKLEAMAPQRRS